MVFHDIFLRHFKSVRYVYIVYEDCCGIFDSYFQDIDLFFIFVTKLTCTIQNRLILITILNKEYRKHKYVLLS